MDWNNVFNKVSTVVSFVTEKLTDPNTLKQIDNIKNTGSSILTNARDAIGGIQSTVQNTKEVIQESKEAMGLDKKEETTNPTTVNSTTSTPVSNPTTNTVNLEANTVK